MSMVGFFDIFGDTRLSGPRRDGEEVCGESNVSEFWAACLNLRLSKL